MRPKGWREGDSACCLGQKAVVRSTTSSTGRTRSSTRDTCPATRLPPTNGRPSRTAGLWNLWMLSSTGRHIGDQLLRSATSVAANYAEASEAESPADFVHKLKLVQKELKESRVWLLFASRLSPGEVVERLRSESRELLLMIAKSINTALARTKDNTIGA